MVLRVLAPVLPFMMLLLTRRRWVAIASALAGGLAGGWIAGMVFPFAERGWLWWVFLGYASLVSLVMAIAETLVAAVMERGRFFRGLLWSLAAHAGWLAYLFGLLGDVRRPPTVLLLVQTAMLGAAAATLGAARRPPRPAGA